MKILAKMVNGREIDIEIDSSSTVEEVRKIFAKKIDYDPLGLVLIHNAQKLETDKNISDYEIKEGSIIYFIQWVEKKI